MLQASVNKWKTIITNFIKTFSQTTKDQGWPENGNVFQVVWKEDDEYVNIVLKGNGVM